MSVPPSVTKIHRNGGITFISSVNRVNYTINELSRAALRDVAKIIRKKTIAKIRTLPGLRRSKMPYKYLEYWVRARDADLQIGFGNTKKGGSGDTWFAIRQELGSNGNVRNGIAKMPKKGFLRNTVFENINEIRNIEAQYLSAINNEPNALRLINESEIVSGDGEQ